MQLFLIPYNLFELYSARMVQSTNVFEIENRNDQNSIGKKCLSDSVS